MQELGLASQAAGPDPGPRHEPLQGHVVERDEDIPWIFPFRNRQNLQTTRQMRRDILHAVHGQIDLAAQQGLFNLLDEESLASDAGQRRVEDLVPGSLDPLERHREPRLQLTQACMHPLGLPESQLAPAGADHQFSNRLRHTNASRTRHFDHLCRDLQ